MAMKDNGPTDDSTIYLHHGKEQAFVYPVSFFAGPLETYGIYTRFRLSWYAISDQLIMPYTDVIRKKLAFRDE